jgi:GNAT superfamily N-acetyltransferase
MVASGRAVDLREVSTDADFECWRSVRLTVVPHERAATVDELKGMRRQGRLLLLAEAAGEVVGSGVTEPSMLAGRASIAVRVLPAYRRRGIGAQLLRALSGHAHAQGHLCAVGTVGEGIASLRAAVRLRRGGPPDRTGHSHCPGSTADRPSAGRPSRRITVVSHCDPPDSFGGRVRHDRAERVRAVRTGRESAEAVRGGRSTGITQAIRAWQGSGTGAECSSV